MTAYGAVGDGRTDDTAAVQRALDDARLTGGGVYFPAGIYLVSNVRLDYGPLQSQSPEGPPFGFPAPLISGAGPLRSTLRQIDGSSGPVFSVNGKLGSAAGPAHNNKVAGLEIRDLGIHGASTGGHGLALRSIVESSFRNLRIQSCGGSGVYIARHTFVSGVNDEYAYGLEFEGVKSLANGVHGFECETDNAISATLVQCDASKNARDGFMLCPSSMTMVGCFALGNGAGRPQSSGLRAVGASNPHSSNTALTIIGCRFEANSGPGGYDVLLQAGSGYSVLGCSVFSTAGAHGLGIGVFGSSEAGSVIASTSVTGGSFGGDGRTDQQSAIVVGGGSRGASISNPALLSTTFAGDRPPADLVELAGGAGTRLQL